MPEWLKGADCKSAGLRLQWFEPTSTHLSQFRKGLGPAQVAQG